MSRLCEKCGQPLPEELRRDPPLPPLDQPDPVTLHDLSDPASARIVEIKQETPRGGSYVLRRLREEPCVE